MRTYKFYALKVNRTAIKKYNFLRVEQLKIERLLFQIFISIDWFFIIPLENESERHKKTKK